MHLFSQKRKKIISQEIRYLLKELEIFKESGTESGTESGKEGEEKYSNEYYKMTINDNDNDEITIIIVN